MHEKEEQLQDNHIKSKHHNYSTFWKWLRARESNRTILFVNRSQVNKHDYREHKQKFMEILARK